MPPRKSKPVKGIITYPDVDPATAPSNILITLDYCNPNADPDDVIGQLSVSGGDGTYLWEILDNAKFELSSDSVGAPNLERSASGSLTPGSSEAVTVRMIDGLARVTSRTLRISVDTLPTAVTFSPNPVTIADDAPAGTFITTPATTGGRAPYTDSVTDDVNYVVSESNVVRSNTPGPLTPGSDSRTVRTSDVWGNTFDATLTITVQDSATGVELTSFDIENWSASSSPGLFRCGMPFTQGQIPTGSVPQIRLSGTPLTGVQFDEQVYWPDGSLQFTVAKVRDTTFSGLETRSYTIWSITGSYDNTSAVTLSDITGASSCDIHYTTVTQYNGTTTVQRGSGAFTASLDTQAAVPTRCWRYGGGGVCDEWEVWGPAIDDFFGTPDPHLTTVWYPSRWKNADGTLAGIEICPVSSQFWWSIANKFRLNYDATFRNSGATIQAYAGVQHPYRSQWAAIRLDSDNNYAKRHWIAGSATIPTLTYKPDKSYWYSTGIIPPVQPDWVANASAYNAPFVPCGNMNHRANIDGTGSYMGRGLMPNSDFMAFLNQTAQSYRYMRTNAHAGLHIPYHFRSNNLRQRPASAGCPGGDATPDTAATIISLKLNPLPTIDYTFTAEGMPAPVDAYVGTGQAIYKDGYVTATGGAGVWVTSASDSHAVAYSYFSYLHEGERYFMQATLDLATKSANSLNSDDSVGGGRPFPPYYSNVLYRTTFSIPQTQYAGIIQFGYTGNPRHIGWGMMLLGQMWAVCPAADVQRGFVEAFVSHNNDYLATYLDYIPVSQLSAGTVSHAINSPWQINMDAQGSYMNYQLTKSASALAMGDFFAQNCIGIVSTHIYRSVIYRSNGTPKTGAWAPTTNEFFAPADVPVNQVRFSIASNVLTAILISPGNDFPLTNGDLIRPCTLSDTTANPIPTGLTDGGLYYVINASTPSGDAVGQTCQLSLTPGGAAVTGIQNVAAANFSLLGARMNDYTAASAPPFALGGDSYGPICNGTVQMAARNGNAAAIAQLGRCNTFFASSDAAERSWVTWRLRAL